MRPHLACNPQPPTLKDSILGPHWTEKIDGLSFCVQAGCKTTKGIAVSKMDAKVTLFLGRQGVGKWAAFAHHDTVLGAEENGPDHSSQFPLHMVPLCLPA